MQSSMNTGKGHLMKWQGFTLRPAHDSGIVRRLMPFICLLIVPMTTPVHAQGDENEAPAAQRTFVVGTKSSPPFSIQNEDGTWEGISIELWETIADRLDFELEYQEMELADMLDGLEAGSLDVAVAALSITAEREARIDFTHSYFNSGLGIAVPTRGGSYLSAMRGLVSLDFFNLIGFLLLVLGAIGLLVWLFERQKNADQFGGSAVEGIGSGLWWSAVTMTTVGYGDKAPITFIGRVIGLIWMFAGLLAISAFTAAITSTFTVSQLESSIGGPDDLARAHVGTLRNSTSQTYLQNRNIRTRDYDLPDAGIQAIATGDLIDAFVYDAPILRYLAAQEESGGITVLPVTFEHQQYGFALPAGSPIRESINRVMLEILDEDRWQEIVDRYLGS